MRADTVPGRGRAVAAGRVLGPLHVLTDHRLGDAMVPVATAAVVAGAPVLQIRVKGWTDAEVLRIATELAATCRIHGTTCIVNDRADIAVAAGADGVHLGADDLPVEAARRVVGPDRLVGATARDPGQARRLEASGADYIGVGPAFTTSTKAGLPAPLGTAAIAAIVAAVSVPVIAIGGIDAERMGAIRATGAAGAAMLGAVSARADPGAAVVAALGAWGPA